MTLREVYAQVWDLGIDPSSQLEVEVDGRVYSVIGVDEAVDADGGVYITLQIAWS